MSFPFNTTASRSRNMRAIKAISNFSTEGRFRAHLVRSGISGWQLRVDTIVGRPDFFFGSERLAVFVDGCFWHGCPKCGHVPKSNRRYWIEKLSRNRDRDARVRRILRAKGIKVLRFWECELRRKPIRCVQRVRAHLVKLSAQRKQDSDQ
jgi:DNA mismatch endonuclease, patch repair protein